MTGNRYFVDTAFWTAQLSQNDKHHALAIRISRELGKHPRLVTSEAVLTELLNTFSGKGIHLRSLASKLVDNLKQRKSVTVFENDSKLFNAALAKYKKYYDKEWGFTDCSSFVIMEAEQITEALTTDQHFEQAGFVALMKEKIREDI